MTNKRERLSRLAAAQQEIGDLLEARLARQQNAVCAHQSLILQISSAMTSTEPSQLVFYDRALKTLLDAEARLERSKAEAETTRSKLIAARGREKALAARASMLHAHEERRLADSDALESALLLFAKACRKDRVVK